MKFQVGSKVSWSWLGRRIQGQVIEVYTQKTTKQLKGKTITRNGSGKNPAYLVRSAAGNEALKFQTELRSAATSSRPTQQKTWKTPKMFSDEPAKQILDLAIKASDLKNLGPVTDRIFEKAGIRGAQHFRQLGWQKTMIKIIAVDKKYNHSIFAYALIGALSNTFWNRISDEEKKSAQDFCRSLRPQKSPSRRRKNKLKR